VAPPRSPGHISSMVPHRETGTTPKKFETVVYRSSPPPSRRGAEVESPRVSTFETCGWCGRGGHNEAMCWMKKGACFICGEMGHMARTCRKRRGESRPQFKCSQCEGPHLGKDCPSNARQRPPLNEQALS
jgi:hypothetical protein